MFSLLNFEVDKIIFLVTFIVSDTDYGHMMAISQILYVQYHIWDIFGLGVKSKKKVLKKQLNDGNHGQGTDIAKISADNLAENSRK